MQGMGWWCRSARLVHQGLLVRTVRTVTMGQLDPLGLREWLARQELQEALVA